jgi:hypothetical protein
MSQKHYAPLFKTYSWLRSHGTIDGKCERVLRMISKRYRKVLVVGNTNSGKNTVANAIFAHWHEIGREAIFTPTIECKRPGDLWSNNKWKSFRSCMTTGSPVITPMKYEQEFYGEQYLPGLFSSARHFDVVVDCRRLPDGSRIVSQVFCRRGQSWSCIYRSSTFAGLQIGSAA